MAKDLVTVAAQEIGYKAGTRGYTKYGAWIGMSQAAWCHAFVSWCAYHADSQFQKLVPKTASTDAGMAWYKAEGRFKEVISERYVPKRNDIIYFKSAGASHVGIVESSDGISVKTIEGNTSNSVKRRDYDINNITITGYGVVSQYISGTMIDENIAKPGWVIAASNKNNTITVTWMSEGLGRSIYNVYIDGVVYANGVAAGSYTYDGISAGEHTVGVETAINNKASERVSVKVSVEGKKSSSSTSSSATVAKSKKTKSSSSSKSAKEELKYLKQFLKTIDAKNEAAKKQKKVSYEISKINYHHEVKVDLVIQNGKKLFSPPVIEGLKVVWERKNTAGKMTFQTIASNKYKIQEGNPVLMSLNGQKFFYGFVFSVKRTKDKTIDVTVYDQLRYLKNKDTYIYKNRTTDSLIRMIARDMGLNVGTLAKTKHLITRAEDNLTLFDMISNSLNETLMATGNIYVLYDDCGKLMLKKPTSMKVTSCLIDADTAEDYTYNRSIDQDVYNQIKLEYQNEDKGTVKFYYTRSKKNISKWGTLQYFEKIDSPKLAKIKGQVLLKLYNKVSKTLQISGAFGNSKVRAGSLIPVLLDLGDMKVSSFLLVDKVTHSFDNGIHKMDLSLSGGDFDSSE